MKSVKVSGCRADRRQTGPTYMFWARILNYGGKSIVLARHFAHSDVRSDIKADCLAVRGR